MNTPLPVVPVHPPIAPCDEREAALVAAHQRDLNEKWGVLVGPLIRRRSDGKLVRLPDIKFGHTYDYQAAADLFVLGMGPGRDHGVIGWWINAARDYPNWSPEQQATAAAVALRNHARFLDSLRTNPPAPKDAHLFVDAARPLPAWAKVHRYAPPAPVQAQTPAETAQPA